MYTTYSDMLSDDKTPSSEILVEWDREFFTDDDKLAVAAYESIPQAVMDILYKQYYKD
jgi:hypothetical protein